MQIREGFDIPKYNDVIEKTKVFIKHLESNALTSKFTAEEVDYALVGHEVVSSLPHVVFADQMRTIVSDAIILRRTLKALDYAFAAINAFEKVRGTTTQFHMPQYGATYDIEAVNLRDSVIDSSTPTLLPELAFALFESIEQKIGEVIFVLFDNMDSKLMFYFKRCLFMAPYMRNQSYKFVYHDNTKVLAVSHMPVIDSSTNDSIKKYLCLPPASEQIQEQLKELLKSHVVADVLPANLWSSMAYLKLRIEGNLDGYPERDDYIANPDNYGQSPYMLALLLRSMTTNVTAASAAK